MGTVSYNKLFKLLIDKKMKKGELCVRAGISAASLAKIAKDENVYADILVKICQALQCNIGDIMDVVLDPAPQVDAQTDKEGFTNGKTKFGRIQKL